MHSLNGSVLLQEALLLTTLNSANSSSSNSSSSGSSEILSRIAPSLLRARVTFHLTALALFAVASHSGRAPQRCAASLQRLLLQQGLTALLTNAVSESAVAAAATVSTAATSERNSSSNSSSCYDSASSTHYGDRLSAQYSSAAVAPGLRVTVCDATVLAAVLESTARIYGSISTTTAATATISAASDSVSDTDDTSGTSDSVMAAAGQQAVLCPPVGCASGYTTVQLLHTSSDTDTTAGSDTLTLPLRALYVTTPHQLLRASQLAIGSSVRIAQRDWLQHVLQSISSNTTSSTNTDSSDNSVLLSIAGEAAAVVALGNSDWIGVQTAAGTEAAVPLAALRLATAASAAAVTAAAAAAGRGSSSRRSSSTSTAVSRKKLAAVTRHRRGSATSARTRFGDSPVQLTSPLQPSSSRQRAHSSADVYTKRKHSSSSIGSNSAKHSAVQRSEQPPAYNMPQSAAVEASISSSAESGVRLLPTYADRAAVGTADDSEAVAAEEPFLLARVRGPPPPRRPSNTTASATTAAVGNTQRALYREPEPTQGRVLGHAHDDNCYTEATTAVQMWGTDGRVLRRGSAPAAVAVVYDSPSPPQRPRSARVRSASLSAATTTAATAMSSTEAALLHKEHIEHLQQQQQQQQSQQRRRRPSTASASSHCSSGSVSLHSATLYFEQEPAPPFSERRASSGSSSSGAVCTGPACRTGIAAANTSAGNSDSAKQQHTAASAKPWRPPAGSSAALKQQDIATVRKLNAKVAARLARTMRTERARDEAVYARLLASRVRRAQAVTADSAATVTAATATASVTAAAAAAVPETTSDDASADASAAALAAELDELSSTGFDERVQDVLARLQRRRRSGSASSSGGSAAVVRDSASWKAELRRKLGLPPAAAAADATARSSSSNRSSAKGSWGYNGRSSNSSPQKNGSQRPKTAPGRRGSAEHNDDDIYADSSNGAVETLLI
jgi:trimeric autotransporter adhesin